MTFLNLKWTFLNLKWTFILKLPNEKVHKENNIKIDRIIFSLNNIYSLHMIYTTKYTNTILIFLPK